MKQILFSIGLILSSVFFAFSSVHACEQCAPNYTLNLEETANKSDLVIIGQKVKDGPVLYGPEWVEIKIIRILKGDENDQIIAANSWSGGMCGYGVVLPDNETYVVFMTKEGDRYTSVNQGCSAGPYKVDGDIVFVEGRESLSEILYQRLIYNRRRAPLTILHKNNMVIFI